MKRAIAVVALVAVIAPSAATADIADPAGACMGNAARWMERKPAEFVSQCSGEVTRSARSIACVRGAHSVAIGVFEGRILQVATSFSGHRRGMVSAMRRVLGEPEEVQHRGRTGYYWGTDPISYALDFQTHERGLKLTVCAAGGE